MPFHAHTLDDEPETRWEPLADHLHAVAARAGALAARLGPLAPALVPRAAALALLHDAGKYDPRFQAYLALSHAARRTGGPAPARAEHSTAGAAYARERWPDLDGWLMAYAVAGHHAGLPDGAGQGRGSLASRLAAGHGVAEARAGFDAAIAASLPDALPPLPALPDPETPDGAYAHAFLGRMLFSVLADADALATEGFTDPGAAARRGAHPAPAALAARLRDHMAAKAAALERPDSPVNRVRAAVLARCVAVAREAGPGVFSLTVPTGGGKTLASLSFALEHAAAHGLDRVVYAIPYLSIIEQTADVFRREAGLADAVVEHHSAFDAGAGPDAEEGIGPDRHRLATDNWDAPVIVTTVVQLFESLHAARPGRCRKLHNLARAVIVLDEAQLLPVPHLLPCLAALRELAIRYGSTVLLCTATQPRLRRDQPLAFGFERVTEIVAAPEENFRALARVTVEHAGRLDMAGLAARMAAADQALCILDTRALAAELYRWLAAADGVGLHHLSAAMCAEHRAWVLERVRADLRQGRPCRLVSTQLVEAGVDVDFPLVLRVEAGLDSVAQAAGRCNREGRRDRGRLVVFSLDRTQPTADLARREAAARVAVDRHGWAEALGPAAMDTYFTRLYRASGGFDAGPGGLTADPRGGAYARLSGWEAPDEIPYRSVAAAFHLIGEETETVIVPWWPGGDAAAAAEVLAWIAALRHAEYPGRAARALQRYTVSLYPNQIARLSHALERVGPDGRFLVLRPEAAAYHPALGLQAVDPRARSVESNIL